MTFAKQLATFHKKSWEVFAKTALRWGRKIPLNIFQVKSLAAISLWTAVHIVLGSYLDVSSLGHAELAVITAYVIFATTMEMKRLKLLS